MEKFRQLVVDGNDGTGKSTLVESLKKEGYPAKDRGIPTKMTDDPAVSPLDDELYLILDAPVEMCLERLKQAGKDLNEKYHTVEDLTYYRQKFLEVAGNLENSILIDASGEKEQVFNDSLERLRDFNF